MRAILSLLFTCAIVGNTSADNLPTDPNGGTLVVTYHTGRNLERIERVRFRLTNDKRDSTLYPQPETYCDDGISHVRRVVVNGLPPGRYTLDFIIPNLDGLFADVPRSEIIITPGTLVSHDQAIKPRYARLQGTAVFEGNAERPNVSPILTLFDGEGRVQAQSRSGEFQSSDLPPGEYTLVFEPHPGYETPAPLHLTLSPGAVSGPFHRVYKSLAYRPSLSSTDRASDE